jgi:DNA modification methylase
MWNRRVCNARCTRCGAFKCELGQEPTPDLFVAHLVEAFREVWRVLRDDGICWVNLGDTYIAETRGAGGRGKQHTNRGSALRNRAGRVPDGLKPKDLALVPFRFALAMQAAGWYCRSVAPWLKSNAFPESVKDRPAVTLEQWMMFSKGDSYYYDPEAVKLPLAEETSRRARRGRSAEHKWAAGGQSLSNSASGGACATGRSRRSSDPWYESLESLAAAGRGHMGMVTGPDGTPLGFDFPTTPYKGDHYAAYSPRLVEPMILSSTPDGCCPLCLTPWRRVVEPDAVHGPTRWEKRCSCLGQEMVPATVFDPFTGVASTAIAALALGRRFVGSEIKPEYVQQGHDRIAQWRASRAPARLAV